MGKQKILALIMGILLALSVWSVQGEESFGISDSFQQYNPEDLSGFFEENPLWNQRNNNPGTDMTIEEEGDNPYLNLASASGKDITLLTHAGLFCKWDKTVLKLRAKSQSANHTGGYGALLMKVGDVDYKLVQFDYNGVFLIDEKTKAAFTADAWYDIEIIFDSEAKTITTKVGGLSAQKSFDTDLSEAAVRIQSVHNNSVGIDDVVVEPVGAIQLAKDDFEQSEPGLISATNQKIDGFEVERKDLTSIEYDEATDNKYLKIQGGAAKKDPVVYGANITSTKTVAEFDLRLSETAYNFMAYVRIDGSTRIPLVEYNQGVLKVLGRDASEICNMKEFVSFRFSITNGGSVAAFINGEYFTFTESYMRYDLIGKDFRFHCNFTTDTMADPSVTSAYIDNLSIYTPAPAVMELVESKSSDYLCVKANNPANGVTITPASFLVNGSSDLIERVTWDEELELFRLYLKGGLKMDTDYRVQTVENVAKDFFDQYYQMDSTLHTPWAVCQVTFMANEEEIEAMQEGEITVTAAVKSDGVWPGQIVMAHYQGGKLKEIKLEENAVLENGEQVWETFQTEEDSVIKVFVWSSVDQIKPVFKPTVLD